MADLNAKQADLIKRAYVDLVKQNPEAATAFLVGAGSSPEDARKEVDSIVSGIKYAEKKDALKDFLADVKLVFQDAITDMDITVDPDVMRVKLEVIYAFDEDKGQGDWSVSDPRLWLAGEDKAMSTKRAAGSGRAKVPVPQSLIDEGISTWKEYAAQTYSDMQLEGRSAPRELERVKDEVFMAAKASVTEA